MEIGTYQDCTGGVPSYGAFVNVYPMISYYGVSGGGLSNLTIHPGDIVEAQGTWRNATTKPINWNTNFVDETTNQTVDTDATTNSTFTPVLNSGAVILSSDNHTLTALSTINSGKVYTGVNFSDITGPQKNNTSFGETGALPGFSLVTMQIPGTILGPLSDDGSSFQISFSPSSTSSSSSTSANSSSSNSSTVGSSSASLSVASTLDTTSSSSAGGLTSMPISMVEEIATAVVIVAAVVIATALLAMRRKR
jgi:hypothetical protein